jgi:hypothetical protein
MKFGVLCHKFSCASTRAVLPTGLQKGKGRMHKPIKYVEKAVTVAASGAWAVFERLKSCCSESVADSQVV